MGKLGFIKILNFHASKDTIKKVKKQSIEHEENFVNHKSDTGLLPEYIKNSFQFNNKKTNDPI